MERQPHISTATLRGARAVGIVCAALFFAPVILSLAFPDLFLYAPYHRTGGSNQGLNLDWYSSDLVRLRGVGSNRYRITFAGPGGHSYGAFGMPARLLKKPFEFSASLRTYSYPLPW